MEIYIVIFFYFLLLYKIFKIKYTIKDFFVVKKILIDYFVFKCM